MLSGGSSRGHVSREDADIVTRWSREGKNSSVYHAPLSLERLLVLQPHVHEERLDLGVVRGAVLLRHRLHRLDGGVRVLLVVRGQLLDELRRKESETGFRRFRVSNVSSSRAGRSRSWDGRRGEWTSRRKNREARAHGERARDASHLVSLVREPQSRGGGEELIRDEAACEARTREARGRQRILGTRQRHATGDA